MVFESEESTASLNMTKSLFKIYLVIYFVFAAFTIYVAIFTGIKIPFVIEILPAVALLFSVSNFERIKASDYLFFLALVSFIVIVPRNLDDLSWVNSNEIRNILFISINYFIYRFVLRPEWSLEIADLIINIFKISMYLMLLECVLINISDIANIMESGYLSAFPERNRLYESIMSFIKPFGLYPGTHNAAIAATISILYLVASKTIANNKVFFLAAILVFFICFSLTGFITLVAILLIINFLQSESGFSRVVNFVSSIVFCLLIFVSFAFYDEITRFRSHGKVGELATVPFGESIYMTSISDGLNLLLENPLGTQISHLDLSLSEVYFSRVLMYFGIPMLIFLIWACFTILKNLKKKNIGRDELFYSISFLTLFISSFHYPSIISYPLNILVPLAFVFLGRGKKESVPENLSNATKG